MYVSHVVADVGTRCRHAARILSLGKGAASVFGGEDIFRVLLYCYSLLAMSNVSVTECSNIVVIKIK